MSWLSKFEQVLYFNGNKRFLAYITEPRPNVCFHGTAPGIVHITKLGCYHKPCMKVNLAIDRGPQRISWVVLSPLLSCPSVSTYRILFGFRIVEPLPSQQSTDHIADSHETTVFLSPTGSHSRTNISHCRTQQSTDAGSVNKHGRERSRYLLFTSV